MRTNSGPAPRDYNFQTLNLEDKEKGKNERMKERREMGEEKWNERWRCLGIGGGRMIKERCEEMEGEARREREREDEEMLDQKHATHTAISLLGGESLPVMFGGIIGGTSISAHNNNNNN